MQLSAQLGVQHWTVQTSVGSVLKYKQGTVFSVSPIVGLYQVPSTLAQTSRGLEKLSVTSHVFASVVTHHDQGLVGIRFSSHHLLDADQTKVSEGEGVFVHCPVESRGSHQSHNHHVG